MDVETLITCVFQRPAVWDKKHKMYANRPIVDKCWSEISKEMNCDETELRKKWKYLRDQFTVELRKCPPHQLVDLASDNQTTKWRYFQLLMFLKDVVKYRPSVGVLSDTLATDPSAPADLNEHECHADVIDTLLDGEEGLVTPPHDPLDTSVDEEKPELRDQGKGALSSVDEEKPELRDQGKGALSSVATSSCGQRRGGTCKCNKATAAYSQSILDMERQKFQYWLEKSNRKRDREEDEDLTFFKSLLSHVKKIPDSKKLTFRNRIHEVVEQFVYR